MKAWYFATHSIPPERQPQAWREAMRKLRLPIGGLPRESGFRGEVWCIDSPLGMQFARVDAEAHEIGGRYLNQPAGIWLTLLLKGAARLTYEQRDIELADAQRMHRDLLANAAEEIIRKKLGKTPAARQ